ncbi:6-phosphogluconate dehydrogenase [Escherichia coli]|nr:6-phosphogluconate dehydrogenase [Escherichia coli]
MATIAFLGLGQMGSPMEKNLLQKGHSLQVFDVNTQAVDALVPQRAPASPPPSSSSTSASLINPLRPHGSLGGALRFFAPFLFSRFSTDAFFLYMSSCAT